MRTTLPENAVLMPDEAKLVFKGIIYDTYQWEQELFDGTTATFEMLKRPDTVKVIAIKNDKIVILEVQQPNHRPFYDIPGGRHDHDDEDELQSAQRELLEETGLTFKKWKLLSVSQPNGKIEQFVYTFLAWELVSEGQQSLDGGEKITVSLMDFDEAKRTLSSENGRWLPDEIASSSSIEDLLNLPAV